MPPKTYECYTDESGISKPNRYMVIGGIILKQAFAKDFEKKINDYRNDNNMHAELKWKKVSIQKIGEYINFVNLISGCKEYVHYKCLVVDQSKLKHKKYNEGDQIIGYYKFLYQLVIHCFGRYFENGDKCYLRIDQRYVNYSLDEFKTILNSGLRKKYPSIKSNVIMSVEPRNSKLCNMIQVADILTGGISFCLNREYLEKYTDHLSKDKIELSKLICNAWEIANPLINTPVRKTDFSIWHFRLGD
jgi:hypothetical protein